MSGCRLRTSSADTVGVSDATDGMSYTGVVPLPTVYTSVMRPDTNDIVAVPMSLVDDTVHCAVTSPPLADTVAPATLHVHPVAGTRCSNVARYRTVSPFVTAHTTQLDAAFRTSKTDATSLGWMYTSCVAIVGLCPMPCSSGALLPARTTSPTSGLAVVESYVYLNSISVSPLAAFTVLRPSTFTPPKVSDAILDFVITAPSRASVTSPSCAFDT